MRTKTLSDFNILVNQHRREIFGYLWRMMHDVQDAEDALQEAFLRAFLGFPHLQDDSNLRAWLYKIATNVAFTHLKRRTRLASRITDLTEFTLLVTAPNPHTRDLVELVLQAIEKLPRKQHTALMLRNYQGLSYQEIGTVLSCTPESARANVYLALKKLRNQFSEVTL